MKIDCCRLINIKNIKLIFVFTILIIIFMSKTSYIFAFSNSKGTPSKIESNKNAIDIIQIRDKNTETVKRQIVLIDERFLDFTTVRRTNDNLPKNQVQVVQIGKMGKEQISIKKVYENDQLIEEDIITNFIIEAPVPEIIEIGTKEMPASSRTYDYVPLPSTYETRKASAFARLSFGMDLRQPSGLAYEDFQKIMLNEERDRYNVFANNAYTFYAIERKYNINGIFMMALAIHESGWGTSNIAKDKKNLFGYGAYDSNPYHGAYTFDTYAEGIELVAKVLVRHYLNTEGTPVFEGQVATGSWYNGPTLAGINVRYATDPEWGNKIFRIMEYLYGKL